MENPPDSTITAGDPCTRDEANLSLLAHLSTFASYLFPFGNLIAPLVVYLVKKDESAFVRHHAAEALNFQISLTIYTIMASILILVVVGIPLLIVLWLLNLVLTIIAAVKASDGVWYRYPLTIRLVH